MQAEADPTVTVPVAAVNLINTVIDLVGPAVIVWVTGQDDPDDWLRVVVQWDEDAPQQLRDRMQAAADEVNAATSESSLLGVREDDFERLQLFLNI